MANVLGELFGDIAAAIREKTGNTAKMKPADFPGHIDSIDTVNNQNRTIRENGTYSADEGYTGLGEVIVEVAGSGGRLVAKRGTFTATGVSQTITHGLGTVPILAWIFPSAGIGDTSDSYLLSAVGIGQKVMDSGNLTNDVQYCIYVNDYLKTWSQSSPDDPIDSKYGSPFTNATDSQITVGSSIYKLKSGNYYTWTLVGFAEN